MPTTILWQPAPISDTATSAPSIGEAAEQGALASPVLHDDYCAIHDEYGTCTCAAPMLAESSEEE
jgi:hypothetical protein